MRRRGFTLIDMVTVLCIVVVVLTLLAPAFLKARAQARSRQCQNNLKQIGIALHNYHDVYGAFGPGWTNHYGDSGIRPRYGWQLVLTPFLEFQNTFQQVDFEKQNQQPRKLFEQTIPVFRCPADSTSPLNEIRANFATSNYSGNFGPQSPPRWVPGSLGEFWPGRAPTLQRTNGIFWLNSHCRLSRVTDGSSNVFAVGERCLTSGSGIWMGVTGNEYEDDAVTDCGAGNNINSGYSSFSSPHEGGAYFVLCDGRVQFISDQIDSAQAGEERLGTFQKLSHRSDGQPVNEI